jgi:hypothetical protein
VGAPPQSAIAIFSPRNAFAAAVAVAPDEAFERALSKGWVAAASDAERWRLTAAGASTLRAAKNTAQPRTRMSRRPTDSLAAPFVNDAESPLAWLRRHRDRNGAPLISAAQFDAGERLRADLWYAQMTPRVTSDWSGIAQSRQRRRSTPGAGIDIADGVVAARQRVHRALCAAGVEFAGMLIDVCGHLKGVEQIERSQGWPQRSAKFFLRHALTALARHYGLIREEEADAAIASRLRHWGASDYRPTLEAWKQESGPGSGRSEPPDGAQAQNGGSRGQRVSGGN